MTFFALATVIGVISIVALTIFRFLTRNYGYWTSKGVVELKPQLLFGNFANCCFSRKSPGEFLRDTYNKGKSLPYIGFYLFDEPALLIRDLTLIKQVLVKDFNYFHDRHNGSSARDIIGNATLFFLKNPHWKTVRTKLTPTFSSGKIKHTFQLMIAVGEDLDRHLDSFEMNDEGHMIELKDLCAKYTTDVLGTCAYGLKTNSLNDPEAEFRKYGKTIFDFNLWRGLELTSLLFAPKIARLFGCKLFSSGSENFLRKALWDTLTMRMKNGERRNDLIDTLIDMKKEQEQIDANDPDVYVFNDDRLVALAANFFAAGFETSSATMSFALYELAVHPHVQSKLRNEIVSSIEENGGEVTYDMIMQLPYLDMVVCEAMRKYPSLPFLDRIAATDYTFSGTNLTIEKGIPIYISIRALHMDPEYFPEPEKFDPERFTEENKRARPPTAYLPFGEGPHNCIGMRFGVLQVKLGLVRVIAKYELVTCPETMIPVRFNPNGILVVADGGLFVRVRRINA